VGTINEFLFVIKVYCERQLTANQDIAALNHKINHTPTGVSRMRKQLYWKPINDIKILVVVQKV